MTTKLPPQEAKPQEASPREVVPRGSTPLWARLKQLVALDLKKRSIQSDIDKLTNKITQDNQILPELQATIDEIKRAVIEAKKNVDLQELNANDLSEQEKQKRAALDTVKNQKQYEALEKELSSLSQQASELDDVQVKTWHHLDLARKKEEAETGALEEKIAALKNDIDEKQETIATLEKESATIEQERTGKTEGIPQEWLKKYELMKVKVADPIVSVINTSCSSCYYSVPPQDMGRLKNNAILLCRSCYRLLYYDQEEEKDLETASF